MAYNPFSPPGQEYADVSKFDQIHIITHECLEGDALRCVIKAVREDAPLQSEDYIRVQDILDLISKADEANKANQDDSLTPTLGEPVPVPKPTSTLTEPTSTQPLFTGTAQTTSDGVASTTGVDSNVITVTTTVGNQVITMTATLAPTSSTDGYVDNDRIQYTLCLFTSTSAYTETLSSALPPPPNSLTVPAPLSGSTFTQCSVAIDPTATKDVVEVSPTSKVPGGRPPPDAALHAAVPTAWRKPFLWNVKGGSEEHAKDDDDDDDVATDEPKKSGGQRVADRPISGVFFAHAATIPYRGRNGTTEEFQYAEDEDTEKDSEEEDPELDSDSPLDVRSNKRSVNMTVPREDDCNPHWDYCGDYQLEVSSVKFPVCNDGVLECEDEPVKHWSNPAPRKPICMGETPRCGYTKRADPGMFGDEYSYKRPVCVRGIAECEDRSTYYMRPSRVRPREVEEGSLVGTTDSRVEGTHFDQRSERPGLSITEMLSHEEVRAAFAAKTHTTSSDVAGALSKRGDREDIHLDPSIARVVLGREESLNPNNEWVKKVKKLVGRDLSKDLTSLNENMRTVMPNYEYEFRKFDWHAQNESVSSNRGDAINTAHLWFMAVLLVLVPLLCLIVKWAHMKAARKNGAERGMENIHDATIVDEKTRLIAKVDDEDYVSEWTTRINDTNQSWWEAQQMSSLEW
jgi:hypothetical protein